MAQVWPKSAEFGRCLAELGHIRPDFEDFDQIWSEFANIGQNMAQHSAKFGPNFGRISAELWHRRAKSGRKLGSRDDSSATLGQLFSNF